MDIRHLMKKHAECCRRRRFARYVRRKLKHVRVCPAGEIAAPEGVKLIGENAAGPVKPEK